MDFATFKWWVGSVMIPLAAAFISTQTIPAWAWDVWLGVVIIGGVATFRGWIKQGIKWVFRRKVVRQEWLGLRGLEQIRFVESRLVGRVHVMNLSVDYGWTLQAAKIVICTAGDTRTIAVHQIGEVSLDACGIGTAINIDIPVAPILLPYAVAGRLTAYVAAKSGRVAGAWLKCKLDDMHPMIVNMLLTPSDRPGPTT
jgi:hypothetical protein